VTTIQERSTIAIWTKSRNGLTILFLTVIRLLEAKAIATGALEDSILLHAFLNYEPVLKHQVERLKQELKQESILVVKSPLDYEVV